MNIKRKMDMTDTDIIINDIKHNHNLLKNKYINFFNHFKYLMYCEIVAILMFIYWFALPSGIQSDLILYIIIVLVIMIMYIKFKFVKHIL